MYATTRICFYCVCWVIFYFSSSTTMLDLHGHWPETARKRGREEEDNGAAESMGFGDHRNVSTASQAINLDLSICEEINESNDASSNHTMRLETSAFAAFTLFTSAEKMVPPSQLSYDHPHSHSYGLGLGRDAGSVPPYAVGFHALHATATARTQLFDGSRQGYGYDGWCGGSLWPVGRRRIRLE